ncbi:MAG: hypothetical protein A2W91_12350 [Bacteroidetes bacterium GWF2_38_335]|nr:MAG: hypothetical protein A2W91_12350 [Bacteroidetes bacterium GWF2_38_335]OFY76960.1 MAG: hypothetical protein A2281_00465 [Bacteroidetes bacterium RIFOXYA12_FULL_38_20]HBS86814.1 hypothetical protein [Bacteroidales bacterium]
MKKILVIFLIGLALGGRAQEFVPFGEDSLYNSYNSPSVMRCIYPNGQNLYIGGGAIHYGGTESLYQIGYYYNDGWHSMDNGFDGPSGQVFSIMKYNNEIYIGGMFSDMLDLPNTESIARFNGTNWEAVANTFGALNGYVFDMAVYDNKLVIGGGFHSIGGVFYNFPFIAAYDGTDFISMDTLPDNVMALGVLNGELYSGGGWFTLKKYNTENNWEDVGGHMNYYIRGMMVDTINSFLYVSGGFNIVDDSLPTDAVAIWDGFTWSPIGGSGIVNDIYTMTIYRGDLYCNSGIDTIGGVFTGRLIRWDGSEWSPGVPGGINFAVTSLAVYDDMLWIGGWGPLDGTMECPMDTAVKTLARWYLPPDTSCKYLNPRVQTYTDTFYVGQPAQFYNNNPYVQTWQWDFGDSGTANVKDPMHIYTATGDYNVQVTVTDGACVKTATKTIHVLLGDEIPEIENIDFKIYPNPSDGMVYVEVGDSWESQRACTLTKREGLTLRITGLNGHTKTTVPVTGEKTAINTTGWAKGTYLVNLFMDGKLVRTEKLVVE